MKSLEEKIKMEKEIININIESEVTLSSPRNVMSEIPISDIAYKTVIEGRKAIQDILEGKDKRKIIIVGPCSIYDPCATIDYARKLAKIAKEVKDEVLIVMRTYLEKPRSTVGWKGIIDDPDLDESMNIEKGLRVSRRLLLEINELGLPCANELLREDIPPYIADLISWGAVGARTVESQPHRELASGLSMPIGFKNNTAGDIKTAVDAVLSARYPHIFLGINSQGQKTAFKTRGNAYSHIVLRGGNGGPNYHPERIKETLQLMTKAKINAKIIVDCSHANSEKQYERQEPIAREVLSQILEKEESIAGIMLESNLYEGKQDSPKNKEERDKLKYGISITDSCISLETTEKIIREYATQLKDYRNTLKQVKSD